MGWQVQREQLRQPVQLGFQQRAQLELGSQDSEDQFQEQLHPNQLLQEQPLPVLQLQAGQTDWG